MFLLRESPWTEEPGRTESDTTEQLSTAHKNSKLIELVNFRTYILARTVQLKNFALIHNVIYNIQHMMYIVYSIIILWIYVVNLGELHLILCALSDCLIFAIRHICCSSNCGLNVTYPYRYNYTLCNSLKQPTQGWLDRR